MKLSLAIATHNEEKNIAACIESCRNLATEVVIVDGSSTDRTVEIAKSLGAKVIVADNPRMFHINKQKAIDCATGDWILQLDADERVTPELAGEIRKVLSMSGKELEKYEEELPEKELFLRHQDLVGFGKSGGLSHHLPQQGSPREDTRELHTAGGPNNATPAFAYNAFFIPRLNYFLGTYLRHGGVYPDGVIRLIRKGKARLPCKSVHELMEVEGKTGWLQYPLEHIDSPTFKRYLERNSRYIDHMAHDMEAEHLQKNASSFIDYMFLKPLGWFFMTTIRHKGILDGIQGLIFSFFSALRFPRAYWRYLKTA